MTQDRFSAQLRQHLLDSANERAAEGQLTAVVGAVARTSQRTPLVARLTWNPGRIGPLPSAAVRYGLLAATLALATTAGALLGGAGGGASTVFEGTWIAIDPADGSGMTLVVGPGQAPAVYFEDGYASGAACVRDGVKRFTARGTGQISTNALVTTFPDGGGCGLRTVGVPGTYVYDEPTDTLSDQDRLVWSRALGEPPNPLALDTPAPTASPEPSAPSSTPRQLPRAGESTFTSSLHGISLQHPEAWRTRPATEPWSGDAVRFSSAAADVIFHPELADRLFLAVASQAYGGLTQDEWRNERVEWICPDGAGGGSWRVDGAEAVVVECDFTSSALIFTESRGYLIRLVAPSTESAQVETYGSEWLKALLETVDLRPEEAVER